MAWNDADNLYRGISRKRKLLGWTQHALAKETGIAVGRIVFAETGRCTLEPDELDRIRAAFKRRLRKVNAQCA